MVFCLFMYDSLQLLTLFLVPKELSKFRVLIPMGFPSRLSAVFVRVLDAAPSAIRVSGRFLLSFRTAVVKSSKLPGSNVYLSFLLFFSENVQWLPRKPSVLSWNLVVLWGFGNIQEQWFFLFWFQHKLIFFQFFSEKLKIYLLFLLKIL